MANWTKIPAPARGAFNTKTLTRVAGGVITLMLAVVLIGQMLFPSVPTEPEAVPVADAPAGPRAGAQLEARVQDIEQRAALERDAAERSLGQSRDDLSLAGGRVTPAYDPTTGALLDPATAGPGAGVLAATEAEAQLREQLRLEAIERQSRSIRSEPVAISYRTPSGAPLAATGAPDGGTDASTPTPAPAEPPSMLDSLTALNAMAHELDARGGAAELDAVPHPAGAPMPAALDTLAPEAELSPLGRRPAPPSAW